MKVSSILLVAALSLICLQGIEAKKGKGLGLLLGLGGLAAAGGAGALLIGSHHHHPPPPKKHITHIHLDHYHHVHQHPVHVVHTEKHYGGHGHGGGYELLGGHGGWW